MNGLLRIWLVLTLSGLLAACGGGGPAVDPHVDPVVPQTPRAKWTYMVYMAADNNLSDAAIDDLNEMEAIGSTADVNVVVQVEFSSYHSPQAYPAGTAPTTLRGKIRKDTDTGRVTSPLTSAGGNLDMGKPQTLKDFIVWATTNHPADHYALVLWSHGAGWKLSRAVGGISKGTLQDETSGSFMALQGVASAVRDAGQHLDVLNFDACLMAMYEVTYAFKDLASYVVASEEVEPGAGDPYNAILADLTTSPAMAAVDLSRSIVARYKSSYATARDGVTKSAISTAGMVNLRKALDDLAAYAQANISSLRPALQSARDGALSFTYAENKDLGDLLNRLDGATTNSTLKSYVAAARAALASVVVTSQYAPSSDPDFGRSSGLAIFMPRSSEVSSQDLSNYAALPSNSGASGVTWAQLVAQLTTGDTTTYQQDVNGNFAFCVVWDNPAVDIDLYVYEPRPGELYAPWMGTATPNGFLSSDSSITGLAAECYASTAIVEKGRYDVFVNYYSGSVPTTVEIYASDESTGYQMVLQQRKVMGRWNAAPPDTYPDGDYALLLTNPYSDWYFPLSTTRAIDQRPARAEGDDATIAGQRKAFVKRRLLRKLQSGPAPTPAPGDGK